MDQIDYIDEPFEVEIVKKRGREPLAYLTWPSGNRRAVPLDVFRAEHLRATEALAKYDAQRGDVVSIRSSKGG